MSPEDVVNQALVIAGSPNRIGSFYDGTPESIMALDLWSQTRDRLLEEEEPDWATGDANLLLLKSAPNVNNNTAYYDPPLWSDQYPEVPWLYEYQYPDDCIETLQIKPQPYTVPIWKPRPNVFRLNYMGAARTILTNVPQAIIVYVRRVLSPDDWPDGFIWRVKIELAKQFEPLVSPEMHQRHRQQEAQANANPPGGYSQQGV